MGNGFKFVFKILVLVPDVSSITTALVERVANGSVGNLVLEVVDFFVGSNIDQLEIFNLFG